MLVQVSRSGHTTLSAGTYDDCKETWSKRHARLDYTSPRFSGRRHSNPAPGAYTWNRSCMLKQNYVTGTIRQ